MTANPLRQWLRRRREQRETVAELAVNLASASSELDRATLDLRVEIDRLQNARVGASEKAGAVDGGRASARRPGRPAAHP